MMKKRAQRKLTGNYTLIGASNALGHKIKAILITLEGKYCLFMAKLDFNCTNNVAEYDAYVIGLLAAIDKWVKELEVYGDSTLVIYQLQREWETREPPLILYHKYVTDRI